MKVVGAILFALFCVIGAQVVDLEPSNFDQIVDGSKHVLVEFFAPWCGHCKNLAPVWEQLGDAFKKSSNVVIAKVDADKHRELGSRFGVSGFPTLKFFPKGSKDQPKAYSSGRDLDSFIQFLYDETGERGKVAITKEEVVTLTPANFDSIVNDANKAVLVEFYAPWCGHCKTLAPKYEKVAKSFKRQKDVVIAKVDADKHKELGGRFGVSGFPTIKYFGKGASKQAEDYNGGREEVDFVDFINKKVGSLRKTDGSLNENAGRIQELDVLAKKFKSGDDATLAEAKKVADENKGEWASFYVKVMEKIQQKATYVDDEIARLEKVLEGSISEDKIDQFTIRLNILRSFQA